MKSLKQRLTSSGTSLFAAVALTAAAAMNPADARTLSFASAAPPADTGINEALLWYADEVKKRTNGDLEIKVYWMGSLVKLKDAVDGVSAGIADMGYVIPAYSHSKMPLWYLSSLGISSGDQYVVQEAFRRVRERIPALKEEEKKNNFKYIAHYSIGPSVLLSKKRPYVTPADFNGDKVRLASRYVRAAKAEGWKVTPVNLSFPEIYSALERGTIDGAVSYLTYIDPFKHNEVTKYVVRPNMGQQTNPIVMNLDTWNSLSKEQQKVFEDLQQEYMLRMARGDIKDTEEAAAKLKNDPKHPMEIITLTEAQQAAWEPGMRAAEEINVERSSQHNPAAREIFDAYLAEIEKVEKEVAEKGYPWERK